MKPSPQPGDLAEYQARREQRRVLRSKQPHLPGRCRCGRRVVLLVLGRSRFVWVDPETADRCAHE
jgi:hypothetical protein